MKIKKKSWMKFITELRFHCLHTIFPVCLHKFPMMFPTCSPKVFPIAPHFIPPRSWTFINYSAGLKGSTSITFIFGGNVPKCFPQNKLMGLSKWLLATTKQNQKRKTLGEHCPCPPSAHPSSPPTKPINTTNNGKYP
jgi:hypothetical protein